MSLVFLLAVVASLADIRTVDARTPRDVQIALAESAAPDEVARAATIYVIGSRGYQKVRQGTNGFTCLITRERPDTLEPECFDAEGTATTVLVRLFTEQQRAAGAAESQITAEIAAGYKSGRFVAPRKPGIVYMLSANKYVFDLDRREVIHFPGHRLLERGK